MAFYQKHLFFCTNLKDNGKKCCNLGGGEGFFEYAKMRIKDLGLWGPDKVRVSKSGCLGRCSLGPSLVVYPEATWYSIHNTDELERVISQHIVGGQMVEELLMPTPP